MTTFNPADEVNCSFSGGNLIVTFTGADGGVRSTTTQTSGKYHVEFKVLSIAGGTKVRFGFCSSSYSLGTGYLGVDLTGLGTWSNNPVNMYYNNFASGTYGLTMPAGYLMNTNDIIALEMDFTNQFIWYQNATSGPATWNGNASYSPAAGSGGFSSSGMTVAPWYIIVEGESGSSLSANFGATGFSLAPSSGFSAWDPSVGGTPFLAVPNYDGNPMFYSQNIMY